MRVREFCETTLELLKKKNITLNCQPPWKYTNFGATRGMISLPIGFFSYLTSNG